MNTRHVAISISLVVLGAGCSSSGKDAPEKRAPAPSAAAPAPAADEVRVTADAEGFHPSSVTLGNSQKLVFVRTSEGTCATEVAFPDLGIKKALPLNVPTPIDLPKDAPKTFVFQCGMGMFKGSVVAH